MKTTILMAVGFCSIMFVGCASVPTTSATLDSEAKKFTPDPGKASIYVNREGGMGTALLFQTVLDGRIVGSLAQNTYQLLSVSPGKHSVTMTGSENTQQQNLSVEGGTNYFLNVSVHMGWVSGRVHIDLVSDDQGRKLIMHSKRAETTDFN